MSNRHTHSTIGCITFDTYSISSSSIVTTTSNIRCIVNSILTFPPTRFYRHLLLGLVRMRMWVMKKRSGSTGLLLFVLSSSDVGRNWTNLYLPIQCRYKYLASDRSMNKEPGSTNILTISL